MNSMPNLMSHQRHETDNHHGHYLFGCFDSLRHCEKKRLKSCLTRVNASALLTDCSCHDEDPEDQCGVYQQE
jgi:hypothetical protein